MSAPLINDSARAALELVFNRADHEVATAIERDQLHRGTALFVMKQFALQVEKLDRALGSELVAAHAERAASAPGSYTALRGGV